MKQVICRAINKGLSILCTGIACCWARRNEEVIRLARGTACEKLNTLKSTSPSKAEVFLARHSIYHMRVCMIYIFSDNVAAFCRVRSLEMKFRSFVNWEQIAMQLHNEMLVKVKAERNL